MAAPPEELRLSLELVSLDGVPLRTSAREEDVRPPSPLHPARLYADLRFEPRPASSISLEAPERDTPLLVARFDLSAPLTQMHADRWRAHAGAWLDRFAFDAHTRCVFGWLHLCAPRPVELPTPYGVELTEGRHWHDDADIVLGMDVLELGCLFYVGGRSGMLPSTDRAGRFWFMRAAP